MLPLVGGRAVGGPIALGVLASYVALALAGWLAAAIALLVATPDLAGGHPMAPRAVLDAHLVALGLLPFAITGASFHLLPVMLRNDVRHPRPKQAALYPRWVWLAEAVSFAFGVEVLAVGALAGSLDVTIAGGMLPLAAAALAITGAGVTWAARR